MSLSRKGDDAYTSMLESRSTWKSRFNVLKGIAFLLLALFLLAAGVGALVTGTALPIVLVAYFAASLTFGAFAFDDLILDSRKKQVEVLKGVTIEQPSWGHGYVRLLTGAVCLIASIISIVFGTAMLATGVGVIPGVLSIISGAVGLILGVRMIAKGAKEMQAASELAKRGSVEETCHITPVLSSLCPKPTPEALPKPQAGKKVDYSAKQSNNRSIFQSSEEKAAEITQSPVYNPPGYSG